MQKLLPLILFVLFHECVNAQVHIRDSANKQKQDTNLISRPQSLQFIAMGDWGRNGADHQKQVAVQLGKAATALNANFIISTGDNFYPSGVISVNDPLFRYSFEDIYTDFSLQWDWYVVLGNHDYKSNPDAQVAYTKVSRRWKMPARYYSKKFAINGDTTQQVLIAFIDTNPLIAEFYKNAEYGPNVRTQDSTEQKKWLEKVLSDSSENIKWKIVVGHHPPYSGGGRVNGYDTKAINKSLKGILDKYGVDVYLAGHEHNLQHITPPGKTQYFISGAASESTPAQLLPISKMAAATYGFMTFSITNNEILVQTIDDKGKVIYKTSIIK